MAARHIHARHGDLSGALPAALARPAPNPQVLCLSRIAGGLLLPPRYRPYPLALPRLGGLRQHRRPARCLPVRRQNSAGRPGWKKHLRLLHRRADYRVSNHWVTFSAEQMYALIMLGAFLLFAPAIAKRRWIWISAAALIALAVLLAETRGVWIGSAVAALYLVWHWNRKLVFAVPALALIVFLVSPAQIRGRFESLVRPRESDSNAFRLVVWRTGLRMIRAHPLLGLGPEGPHYRFDEFVAPDTPRPLPDGWYGHLHNIYLQYAAERGIPTMLVMMWLIARSVLDFHRRLAKLPPGRGNRRFLLYGAIAVILATLTEGLVDYNLGDSEVLTMFLVVLACGYLALEPDLAFD